MAECSICSEFLFPASTSSAPALPQIVSLPCGHVHHHHCIQRWFATQKTRARCCPNCRELIPKPSVALRKLFFDGTPGGEGGAEGGGGLAASVKRLTQQAANLGVESEGRDVEKALEGVKELSGALEVELKEPRQWEVVTNDDELRSSLISLSTTLKELRSRLHYTYRIDSYKLSIASLTTEKVLLTKSLEASSHREADAERISRDKYLSRLAHDQEEWARAEREREKEAARERDRLKVELSAKERAREDAVAEKRALQTQLDAIRGTFTAHEASLASHRRKNSKLTAQLAESRQTIARLETEATVRVLHHAREKERTWNFDDEDSDEGTFDMERASSSERSKAYNGSSEMMEMDTDKGALDDSLHVEREDERTSWRSDSPRPRPLSSLNNSHCSGVLSSRTMTPSTSSLLRANSSTSSTLSSSLSTTTKATINAFSSGPRHTGASAGNKRLRVGSGGGEAAPSGQIVLGPKRRSKAGGGTLLGKI